MMTSFVQSGTQIAAEIRDSSGNCAHKEQTLKTLGDLLDILGENPPSGFPMLRTTCARVADYLGEPLERITIASVTESRDGFRPFLEARKYKENAIRSYVNYVRMLLRSAAELGWKPDKSIPEAWRGVHELAGKKECLDLVRYLSRLRKRPAQVTIEDVDDWIEQRTKQGISHHWARGKRTRLWRLLRDCGCTEQNPICLLREKHYAIPLEQFPPGLKSEAVALLKFKLAEFSAGRPDRGRHREVTSRNLRIQICRLLGFEVTVRGKSEIVSLSQLVQKETVSRYIEFCINERKVRGYGLQCALRLLSTALNQSPVYALTDFSWFNPLLDSIPTERKSERKKRKAERYLEYSVLESIPARIRAERPAAEKKGVRHVALLALQELLVKWLITLPWRQRNIRECRISGPRPNLFKAAIPPFSDIDKPDWVREEEQGNPAAEFWQFAFSVDETKTGIDVHALLPRPLIGLLEEYLRDFRPRLLRGADPGTLFVNQAGNQMSAVNVCDVVTTLTYRLEGTRVNPHLFRDIVSYAWLKAHSKDYLTLSKMLWHSSPDQVIENYGSRFNESSGVVAMEYWLEERQKGRK